MMLDFLFIYNLPEAFSAAFIKAYCKLGSFSILVGSASHFPCFLCVFDVLSTIGAFCHLNNLVYTVTYDNT